MAQMTNADRFILALTAYRENRGGGSVGMQSVINVVLNRAAKAKTTPYQECVKPFQFSSMTARGDSQLTLYPPLSDDSFKVALALVDKASGGELEDITGGATFYYAKSMTTPPHWAASMTKTAEIANQIFFR